jgi:glycine amidinotransferase
MQQYASDMKVSSYTEWGTLKEIIVGDIFNITSYNVDLSFKLFFKKNIHNQFLKDILYFQKKMVEQRQVDLDGIAAHLQTLGIKVRRPEKLQEIKKFQTPYFEDHLKPQDNPRDLTLIYGDEIIETPVLWRGRYFENDLLKMHFREFFKHGARWTQAPRPRMGDKSFAPETLSSESASRDYEPMFDAAQCLKFGRSLVMNISNHNHLLGAKWLKKHLEGKANIHLVQLTDHHIDSMFMPLRPGLMLINREDMPRKMHLLPKGLQSWDTIVAPELAGMEEDPAQVALASRNISVNVLPLTETAVMIFAKERELAAPLARLIEARGMDVEIVRLRHARIFGGGLHCVTLDTLRDDTNEDFVI